MVDFNTN